MQIKLYGVLRQLAGIGSAPILLPASTLCGALEGLTAVYPRLENIIWTPDGDLSTGIRVVVHGRVLQSPDLAAPLGEDDSIHVFPPLAGG